jgi:thiosulfate dehydrogenase
MKEQLKSIGTFHLRSLIILVTGGLLAIAACNSNSAATSKENIAESKDTAIFSPPDTSTIPNDQFGALVRYGRDLIVRTAYYIGPNGTKGKYLGNKMNCTNCHLDAGTRPFGFNFFSSYARYPQYRGRENEVLDIAQRVNNCIERPHSGTPLPLDSKEMVAMVCYIRWVGTNVPIGHHVRGDESLEIEYPDRAADPQKGAAIFAANCASCHGNNGQGKMTPDSSTYIYPPLWGMESYQVGSSPYRVVKLARFIKANMPDKIATWRKPHLTDEQALDVAAFVNDDDIHPRPQKKNRAVPDYPEIKSKALDYGIGPFIDTFSERQHKYGPFKPIISYRKAHGLPANF